MLALAVISVQPLTLFESQHRRPLDRSLTLLHVGDQLLQEVQLLLGVLLAQDGQQVLLLLQTILWARDL